MARQERAHLWSAFAPNEVFLDDQVGAFAGRVGLIAITSHRFAFVATPLGQSVPVWVLIPWSEIADVTATGPARSQRGCRLEVSVLPLRHGEPLRFLTQGGGVNRGNDLVRLAKEQLSSVEQRHKVTQPPVQVTLTSDAAGLITERGRSAWVWLDALGTPRARTSQPEEGAFAHVIEAMQLKVNIAPELRWFSGVELRRSRCFRSKLRARLTSAPLPTPHHQ